MLYVSLLLLTLASSAQQTQCFELFNNPNLSLDKLLDEVVSLFVGQKSADSSVTPAFYETFLMNDNTNEDIATLSTQEIIARSGYKFEDHYVVSDDGYITNLVRIINPLADRTKLKQPPVMVKHGALTDSTCWIWSSAIQHHPEKYPRVAEDGPITSWNKSLAFMLANNGYDVWLVGTRGANIQNKGHVRLTKHYNWFDQQDLAKMGLLEPGYEMDFEENFEYWNYTMDDMGQFEVPRQQQKILDVTGADKVILVDYSQATQYDFALMSENPDFVSKVHNYVTFAPVLTRKGYSRAWKVFHDTACTRIPLRLGILAAQVILSPAVRAFASTLNKNKELRYTVVKEISRVVTGPSAKYETNLDSGVVGHLFEATGYKQFRHYCQQVKVGQMQKYDYGKSENVRVYGTSKPPKYDLSKIKFPDWLMVTGGQDILSTPSSNKELLKRVSRQPNKHIHIDRYSHVDLTAAVENDKFINLPVLDFLDQFALPPRGRPEPSQTDVAPQTPVVGPTMVDVAA